MQLHTPPEMVGLSMTGQVRANNEDSLAFDAANGIAIIADGMGGHSGGEVASMLAVSVMTRELLRPADSIANEEPSEQIENAMLATNRRVLEAANHDPELTGMGTTVLAAWFRDGSLTVGHVGDSRLYRLREGHIERLTRDHTLSAETGNADISRHILTRAVGIRERLLPDIYQFITLPGDLYLLCSDGLSGVVSERKIRLTLMDFGASLDAACAELMRLANGEGSPDNTSLILVASR